MVDILLFFFRKKILMLERLAFSMDQKNAHGLGRDIPAHIKREVRQRDGFGCVLCGNAIIDYDHFDPAFSEALEHKSEGITILCGQCHNKKTRGMLSFESVKRAVANPRCRQSGFSFEAFDIGEQSPIVRLGTLLLIDVKTIIRVLGDNILSIKPPLEKESPFLISAKITDIAGKPIFEIEDNEWKTFSSNWDVEVSGSSIKIRRNPREVALIIRSEPPNKLVIERIHMSHKGTVISGQEGRDITVKSFNGSTLVAQSATFTGCQVGIDVGPFDLRLGVGGGTITIDSMTIGSNIPVFGQSPNMSKTPKLSRNSPCWCGSQIKFKKCHGKFLHS